MRLLRWTLAVIVFAVAAFVVSCRVADPECRRMDDDARAGVAGRFVRLADGVTHYETAGSDTGRAACWPPALGSGVHLGLALLPARRLRLQRRFDTTTSAAAAPTGRTPLTTRNSTSVGSGSCSTGFTLRNRVISPGSRSVGVVAGFAVAHPERVHSSCTSIHPSTPAVSSGPKNDRGSRGISICLPRRQKATAKASSRTSSIPNGPGLGERLSCAAALRGDTRGHGGERALRSPSRQTAPPGTGGSTPGRFRSSSSGDARPTVRFSVSARVRAAIREPRSYRWSSQGTCRTSEQPDTVVRAVVRFLRAAGRVR